MKHKDDCIWTDPNRCNCGWLQDIAKNPRYLVREIERLRAELAECKQEWQTMETAPKDGSRILLATPSGKIADGFWSLEYRVWSWPYVMVEPTHWTRALPIPGRKGGVE